MYRLIKCYYVIINSISELLKISFIREVIGNKINVDLKIDNIYITKINKLYFSIEKFVFY